MAQLLPSRAKVVSRKGLVLLLFLSIHSVFAQAPVTKFTFECSACAFNDLLTQVEEKTGLHFVYSTNKIQTDRRISIRVAEQSADEVLDALGRLTGFHLRRNGQYVIIKNDETKPSSTVAAPLPAAKEFAEAMAPERHIALDIVQSNEPVYPVVEIHAPLFGSIATEKLPVDFSKYFDATRLAALPPSSVRSLNLKNNHPGWFLSTGAFVNNHSVGAEIQAGLRSVYLVYRPSRLRDGRYFGSYGIGVSMLLERNFSWNMSYTYGTVGRTLQQLREIPALQTDITSRHHAARFALKYAITRNISIAGGLSVNLLESRFENVAQAYPPTAGVSLGQVIPIQGSTPVTTAYKGFVVRRLEPAQRPFQTRMWLGWETSLSYRFNFFTRK
jgi:hypothetical protein